LLVYLAVAILILFISSFVGFYLGGPDGATFALGIGLLIDLLVFPVVGIRLSRQAKSHATEEATTPSPASSNPANQVVAHKPQKSKNATPPREKPST